MKRSIFKTMTLRFAAPLCAATLLCLGTTAQAQIVPEIDCAKTLSEIGFGVGVDERTFTLNLPIDAADITRQDPINPIELFGLNQEADLASGVPTPYTLSNGSSGVLGCQLIILEFHGSDANQVPLEASGPDGRAWNYKIPFLLVDTFASEEKEELAFTRWAQNSFGITARFRSFRGERSVAFTSGVVRRAAYLPRRSNSPDVSQFTNDSVKWVSFVDKQTALRPLLESLGGHRDDLILLCGSNSCAGVEKAVNAITGGEQGALASELSLGAEVTQDDITQALIGAGEQGGETDPDPVIEPVVRPVIRPVAPPIIVAEKTPGQFTADFFYKGGNPPRDTSNRLDEFGGLECLLLAVTDDLFDVAPDCDSEIFKRFSQAKPLIKLHEDGRWQIVPNARFPDAQQINVILSGSANPSACNLELIYEDTNANSVRLPLVPVAQASPPMFSAPLRAAPAKDPATNAVTLAIALAAGATEADCGGSTRQFTEVSAREITVTFSGAEAKQHMLAHVTTLHRGDLESELSLTRHQRLAFGRGIKDALQGAHARVATTRADVQWALSNAVIGQLSSTGRVAPVANLNANQLRNQVRDAFDAIGENSIQDSVAENPTLSPDGLRNALAPLVERALGAGADKLTVTLLAPNAGRTVIGANDPCVDAKFQSLVADLSVPNGPEIEIVVFPIVRLTGSDQVNLARLRPIQQDANAISLPGGLYECRGTQANLSIYPFYFEPWRDPVEFAARYSAALSNQIAYVIETTLTEDGVLK